VKKQDGIPGEIIFAYPRVYMLGHLHSLFFGVEKTCFVLLLPFFIQIVPVNCNFTFGINYLLPNHQLSYKRSSIRFWNVSEIVVIYGKWAEIGIILAIIS